MQINKLFSVFFIISIIVSLAYSQEGSFKIGNIKYDYNNLEFSFSEGPADVTFKIGKFSLSTANTSAGFSQNGSGDMNIGPSKVQIQNVHLDAYNRTTRENVKFDLGTVRFDLNQFTFDLNNFGNTPPEDIAFNMKFSANNIVLDLSQFNSFPPDVQQIFDQIGQIDKLALNRATITTSYNSSKQFRFDVDGMTSLANIKVTVAATVDEMYPERTQFQACTLTISNLSTEVNNMIGMIQAQTGYPIPMANGSITFDVKDMLNAGQNPFGGF
tara:strand:- start:478 stop:1290 length:813 start_codon:yes stop_codon:yes gene_type:complete